MSLEDTIYIDNAVFASFAAGTISAANFWTGAARMMPTTTSSTTRLPARCSYDSNGNAAGGSTVFATVAANTALTIADIIIY